MSDQVRRLASFKTPKGFCALEEDVVSGGLILWDSNINNEELRIPLGVNFKKDVKKLYSAHDETEIYVNTTPVMHSPVDLQADFGFKVFKAIDTTVGMEHPYIYLISFQYGNHGTNVNYVVEHNKYYDTDYGDTLCSHRLVFAPYTEELSYLTVGDEMQRLPDNIRELCNLAAYYLVLPDVDNVQIEHTYVVKRNR